MFEGVKNILITVVLSLFLTVTLYLVIIGILQTIFGILSKKQFMKIKHILPIQIIKWFLYDIVKGKKKIDLFGIRCVTGYFGQGKTLFCVYYAKYLRDLYKKKYNIYVTIATNFDCKHQDLKITKWEDLMHLPQYTIVIFDEIQSTFTCTEYKDFPLELLWKITQCRKMGLMVLASSPVFSRMSIQLRENTDFIITAKNVLADRWFSYKFYHAYDYERYYEDKDKLQKLCYKKINIVADNDLYDSYDTSEVVERVEVQPTKKSTKSSISQNEIRAIENNLKKFVYEELKKYQKV